MCIPPASGRNSKESLPAEETVTRQHPPGASPSKRQRDKVRGFESEGGRKKRPTSQWGRWGESDSGWLWAGATEGWRLIPKWGGTPGSKRWGCHPPPSPPYCRTGRGTEKQGADLLISPPLSGKEIPSHIRPTQQQRVKIYPEPRRPVRSPQTPIIVPIFALFCF